MRRRLRIVVQCVAVAVVVSVRPLLPGNILQHQSVRLRVCQFFFFMGNEQGGSASEQQQQQVRRAHLLLSSIAVAIAVAVVQRVARFAKQDVYNQCSTSINVVDQQQQDHQQLQHQQQHLSHAAAESQVRQQASLGVFFANRRRHLQSSTGTRCCRRPQPSLL